jgi:hypothetical protein
MYVDKFTEIRRTKKEGPCLGRRNYTEEWVHMLLT